MEKIKWIAGLILFGLLIAGCATTPTHSESVSSRMENNLNSCLGKLTKDMLIMQASTPTEKVTVNNGEIWIYKYRKSEIKTTTTGAGSLLFPFESVSKSHDYALDVRLRFNNSGVLVNWSFKGHVAAFNHPFTGLRCQ